MTMSWGEQGERGGRRETEMQRGVGRRRRKEVEKGEKDPGRRSHGETAGDGKREMGIGRERAGGRDGQVRRLKRAGGGEPGRLVVVCRETVSGHLGRKLRKKAVQESRTETDGGRQERPCETSSGGCPLSTLSFGRDSEEQGSEALCCLAVLCLFKWGSALDLSHMDHSFLRVTNL